MKVFTKKTLAVMLLSLPGVFFDFFAGHAFADAAWAQNLSFPTHPVLPGTTPGKWTLKLEDVNKVFVENKGQFNAADNKAEQPIEYGVRHNGVEMYFTKSGVIFRHDEFIPSGKDSFENASADNARKHDTKKYPAEKENEEEELQLQPLFLCMTWLGANADVLISAEQQVSNYFTYVEGASQKAGSTIHARAFKKIIYKNIYPGINVEYVFPDNKEGIKYNIILHPGAAPALIKMKYSGANKIYSDTQGNITIVSAFGNFTDHAPLTYDNKGSTVRSSSELNGDTVSFKVDAHAISSLERAGTGFVIIDPWLTTPLFNGANNAYDIDWDYQGNVYAYGGTRPFQLIKLNSAGTPLWTATIPPIILTWYGDFAVDRFSGNSYLCQGARKAAWIYKLDNQGNEIASKACSYMNETWRMIFNSHTRQGIIGGGGTLFSYQAAVFDANVDSILEVNIISPTIGPGHDIALLAADDTLCYMLSARQAFSNIGDNTIIKCNLSDLSPVYKVQGGYNFRENANSRHTTTNGFNGMAKSKNYLYTYDGATLKKWNPLNGAFIKGITISTDTFAYGGITVNGCNENVYLGKGKSVIKYDSTLTFISSFATTDTVFDLAVGPGGNLLACGKGFVSSLAELSPPSPPSFTTSISTGPSTCAGNDGSATVNVTGGTPPFSYLWTSGEQTASGITGLSPGNYPVFVYKFDSLNCAFLVKADTAVLISSSGFTGQSNTSTFDCFEKHNATATENAFGGTMPYTYLWMPGGQTTQTAIGLAAGTYTVTVKDANACQSMEEVIVQPSVLDSLYTIGRMDCAPQVFGIHGLAPYTYLWAPGGATDNYIKFEDLLPVSYSVTVTDAQACSVQETFTMSPSPWSVLSTNLSQGDSCIGLKGAVTIDLKNDSAYSFLYDFSRNTGTTYQTIGTYTVGVLSNLNPGSYQCSIHDIGSCKDTLIDFVINDSSYNSTIAFSENTTIVQGESIRLYASGGRTYLWSTGEKDSGIVVAPLKTTSYIVNIGSGSCELTDTITITVSECGEMFVPNAFSPNNDGNNDVLYVKAECIKNMSFKIFNRWGEKVFEAFNLTSGWDGTYNNKLLNPDMFVYSLEATLNSGEVLTRKGNIVLMK